MVIGLERFAAAFRPFRDMEDFLSAMEATPYDTSHLGIALPYPDVLARIRNLFVKAFFHSNEDS